MIQSTLTLVMDVRTPPLAPLVVLAFLGAGALVVGSAVAGAIALAAQRFRLAKILLGGGLSVALTYATLLAGAALLSQDRVLEAGEKKYFCEIDCHLAYSVAAAGADESGRSIVTIRTCFDSSTIASFRGNGPLSPNPRMVHLVDSSGRRYPPSDPATRAWQGTHGGSTPLTQELRPGESYETTLLFDTPSGASGLRLFVGDPPGIESLLIGHENSPLHGKVYFALPDQKIGSTGNSSPDRITERTD